MKILCFCTIVLSAGNLPAQNLTFTFPQNMLPQASTDKAIDITNFKGGFFVTWKEPGSSGDIHIAYLGRHYDTSCSHQEGIIPDQQTSFAPVLRALNDHIYLFWINRNGGLNYVINRSDTAFDLQTIHTLSFSDGSILANGITSASIGGRLLIATHTADKQHWLYALADPDKDGLLSPAMEITVKDRPASDYPFVVSLNDSIARFCWRGYKEETVYTGDLNIRNNAWIAVSPMKITRSNIAPAIYQVWNAGRLFYIWKGPGNDKKLYYTTQDNSSIPQQATTLPAYFATDLPVSICSVDKNKFILAYTGKNNKLYLSYFVNYNPITWMKDLLSTTGSKATLRDIVIPGAHDAGMSVLNGVGGSQSGTINECNTLTQKIGIGAQLNAGIRMFDLRVGSYNGRLYTKHCSSDCMADAIGGGYGEPLSDILTAIRHFLQTNRGEIVLLTFSHFCEKETPIKALSDTVLDRLGKDIVYRGQGSGLSTIRIGDLAGKCIVTFEGYARPDKLIDSCTIGDRSLAFINFRRAYAASNQIGKFLSRQEAFFRDISAGTRDNDLVRLDWQLTQSSDEAAMICNDFQSEKTNPLVDGAMLLTNVIRKHQSIIDLSVEGNKYLPLKVNAWIDQGIITRSNKPNIIYVDVAGAWVTDYCIGLNANRLYADHGLAAGMSPAPRLFPDR